MVKNKKAVTERSQRLLHYYMAGNWKLASVSLQRGCYEKVDFNKKEMEKVSKDKEESP